MITYKDKTWCHAESCAISDNCDRYLTQHHINKAEKLGLPISQVSAFGCYEPKPNNEHTDKAAK